MKKLIILFIFGITLTLSFMAKAGKTTICPGSGVKCMETHDGELQIGKVTIKGDVVVYKGEGKPSAEYEDQIMKKFYKIVEFQFWLPK